MYDLNLNIPNITAKKYSTDNRFVLLKNYLGELNEKISFALTDKVESDINALSEKYEKEQKETRNETDTCRIQNMNNYNALKTEIEGLSAFEELSCECSAATESPVSYIRYYPFFNAVYLRVRLTTKIELTAGTNYTVVTVPKHTSGVFVPLQSAVGLSSDARITAGIKYKTGEITFRSDTNVPAGCYIYLSGWYPADYEEQEG